jgi:hypothetical protein
MNITPFYEIQRAEVLDQFRHWSFSQMESLMLQRQQKDKKSMLNQKIIPADKN